MARLLLPAIFVLYFSGCASMRAPVNGLLFTDAKAGLMASSNQAGNREGIACASSYFGLFAVGDASIETARRNGAVSMIASVDESFQTVLGVSKYCTIVRGR